MRIFPFFRRPNHEEESRLIGNTAGGDGGIDHLGSMRFNMNPYDKENTPEQIDTSKGDNIVEKSAQEFKTMLGNGVSNVYNGIMQREDAHVRRLQAGQERARVRGRDVYVGRGYGDYQMELRDQLGAEAFDNLMNQATEHIWKMPDMQKGVVEITDALSRAWNYVFDVIQVRQLIPSNHPLIRSESWRNGMRVPGAYWNGRLARIGSNLTGNYDQRKLSGEIDRFKRLPSAELFDNHVDARFRGKVEKDVRDQLEIKDDLKFDRLRWSVVEEGDDSTGKSHVFMLHKDAGTMDEAGEYLPGEAPFNGIVMVYGNQDEPSKTEVYMIDFKDTNAMLTAIKTDPLIKKLVLTPGVFSKGLTEEYRKLLMEIPDDPAGMKNFFEKKITIDFYKQRILGRLQKEGAGIRRVADTLDEADIAMEDLEWVQALNPANNADANKLEKLYNAIKADRAAGRGALWDGAIRSLFPEEADRWYDGLKELFEPDVA